MTKKIDEKLLEVLIENNTYTNQFMESIKVGVEKMNDQNILHTRAVEANTKATNDFLSMQSKIQLLLIVALIILAGVKSVADFF